MTALDLTTEIDSLPTDLWSDEPPLESELHLRQIILLLNCLDWLWQERQDYYAIGNVTIYYSPNQLQKREFCGPDFFGAGNFPNPLRHLDTAFFKSINAD